MAVGQGLTYSVDLVLVIDATGSMSPIIDDVKTSALSFYDDLQKHMAGIGKNIDDLRVRVIAFRDYYADSAADSLVVSDFLELPDQRADFSDFVHGLRATGGGDEPENGLEGLAAAIRSPWAAEGAKQRQVIVMWTDASAHPLEKNKGAKPAGYPADMPGDFDELTDLWEGQDSPVHQSWKRLLLFSPDVYPWTDIANNWDATLHYTSKAGAGLGDKDYKSILDAIAQSV
jgi:von Willebrand factor type A domain